MFTLSGPRFLYMGKTKQTSLPEMRTVFSSAAGLFWLKDNGPGIDKEYYDFRHLSVHYLNFRYIQFLYSRL